MPAIGLVTAVKSGDRRKALTALRDVLATEITGAKPEHVAALARQLVEVLKALDAMPVEKGSKVDELANRRASRRANAGVANGASGADVGRPRGRRARS